MSSGRKNKNNKQNKGKKCGFKENNDGSCSNKKPKLECWKCGKTGHFKKDYHSGNNKNNVNAGGSGKGSKDQSQDQAFYVQVDAIAWWIDSGATTHVCKDRCWFKTYEPVEDGSVLYMGDDHFAPVHRKGSVVLEFSSRKSITLFNVLMFMLNLNKVPDDCGSVYMSYSTVVNTSLWHARLGHVHYKRMLEMSKDYLIPAIDDNPKKSPYTPQQNGVVERKNKALKEMVNSMLSYSGLSEGFWGEAMLTACYLLNRVPNKRNKTTPYELWYKKRPNLSFLRVWSWRAVVRLPNPKRKTLGKKGIDCIFIGYVEHSKAYRFYVIEPNDSISINSIIESRDAIFDENRFSSIPRPNDIIPNSNESQSGDHSNDVPSETPEPRREPIMKLCNLKMLLSEKKAIDDEIGSIMENNTWVLSDLPPGCKPLGYKWIFKRKMKVDETIDKFKARLFSMKDMGESDVILGINIKCENKGIVITQSHYIEKILKKFNREDCSPVSTRMDPIEKLKPNTCKHVDQLEYSRAIGCLMYVMTSTRPDIAYAVGRLSRFISNPSRQHWNTITRVFKYLKDSSSTSGWVFLLRGDVISWASKKQTCITGSNMESEFVALAAVGKEVEWLKNLIHEIPIWLKPISPIFIHCDSAATLAKTYSQIYNDKSRHLGVRHNMIRELIMNGVISIEFVRSQHNLADHLTKGLARDLVINSVIGMGLKFI
ncbi:zinc finger, CCHC-type containing protein [Tanacetum coccineum]